MIEVPSDLPVGVLYDSFSDNVGDIAMLHAIRDALARHGVDHVVPVDLFAEEVQAFRAVIVGGGELIRPTGDFFYDRFRLCGGTVLCAVGVWPDADDLSYLADYEVVTARSSRETSTLRAAHVAARTVPCPTVAMESSDYLLPPKGDLPRVGVHLVPDTLVRVPHVVEIVNELTGEKWEIPFTRYLHDDLFMSGLPIEGTQLPNDLTPRDLRAAIAQMDLVIASSLHVTLFALANGVPFVSMEQPKVRAYLEDRGLEDLLFRDDESLRAALRAAPERAQQLREIAEHDHLLVDRFFADVADRLLSRDEPVLVSPLSRDSQDDRQSVLRSQVFHVLAGRDRLVGTLFGRQLGAERLSVLLEGERRWNVEQAGALAELQDAITVRDARLREQSEDLQRLRHVLPLLRAGSRAWMNVSKLWRHGGEDHSASR